MSTLLSRQGLAGLEFASGIPGSVGGAVYMNAGAHKSDISSVLSKALILFEDGAIDWLTNKELEFSYRASVLQTKRPGIVLEAVFQLQAGNVKKLYVACKIIKITAVKRNHGITRVQEVYFGIQSHILQEI